MLRILTLAIVLLIVPAVSASGQAYDKGGQEVDKHALANECSSFNFYPPEER
jgi:hypothetical protein